MYIDQVLNVDIIVLMLLNNTKFIHDTSLAENIKYSGARYGYPLNLHPESEHLFQTLKKSKAKLKSFKEMFGLGDGVSDPLKAGFENPEIAGFDKHDSQLIRSYLDCHYSIYYLCSILKRRYCLDSVELVRVNKTALVEIVCKKSKNCKITNHIVKKLIDNCPSPCNMAPCKRIANALDYTCRTEYSSRLASTLITNDLEEVLEGTMLPWLYAQQYSCECERDYKWDAQTQTCVANYNCDNFTKCAHGQCMIANGQRKCTNYLAAKSIQIINSLSNLN
jgi:hypothetical protein